MTPSVRLTITDRSIDGLKVAISLTADLLEEEALTKMAKQFYQGLIQFLPLPAAPERTDSEELENIAVLLDDDVEEDEEEEEESWDWNWSLDQEDDEWDE